MKVVYQNLVKLVLVGLIVAFSSCSKSDDKSNDNQGNKLHSYDMVFQNETGSNTFRYAYAGSITSAIQVGNFDEGIGNYGALTLNFNHDSNSIKGGFILKENGNPLNLDYNAYQSREGSLLELHDTATNRIFRAVSGTVTITGKNIEQSSSAIRAASYTLQFDGDFDIFTSNGEIIRCTGTGSVAVGQPIP